MRTTGFFNQGVCEVRYGDDLLYVSLLSFQGSYDIRLKTIEFLHTALLLHIEIFALAIHKLEIRFYVFKHFEAFLDSFVLLPAQKGLGHVLSGQTARYTFFELY